MSEHLCRSCGEPVVAEARDIDEAAIWVRADPVGKADDFVPYHVRCYPIDLSFKPRAK